MDAILQAIGTDHLLKIFNGQAKYDIRKRAPMDCKTFKVYLYATEVIPFLIRNPENNQLICVTNSQSWLKSETGLKASYYKDHEVLSGYVVGEYICKKVSQLLLMPFTDDFYISNGDKGKYLRPKNTTFTYDEVCKYLGDPLTCEGWAYEISDFKLYSYPVKVDTFVRPCKRPSLDCFGCNRYITKEGNEKLKISYCNSKITRPPQDFIHVKERYDLV